MALLRRVLVILLAYIVAAVCGATVIMLGSYVLAWTHPRMGATPLSTLPIGMMLQVASYVFVPLVGSTFVPTMLVAALFEMFRLRSVLVYAVAGGVVAAISLIALRLVLSLVMFRPKPPAHGFVMSFSIPWLILAAGIMAGIVYWAIAGRNAGAWRRVSSKT